MQEEDSPIENEEPADYALRIAKTKAMYGHSCVQAMQEKKNAYVIIAADTVVSIEGIILGKPVDNADALRMLKMLSGKKHTVTTAVHIIEVFENKENIHSTAFAKETAVHFANWSDEVLKAYANSKEPLDKAGAYAIQGKGSFLMSSIEGCWTNVVGLPINTLVEILLEKSIISIK